MKTFEAFLRRYRPRLRPKVLPRQLVSGGEHFAENHAIIGDRLLDVYLYQNLGAYLPSEASGDDLTIRRSKIVSNRNLSRLGEEIHFLILNDGEWARLSEHERATFVEASIAAVFELEGKKLTDTVETILEEVVERLKSQVADVPAKDPVSMVLEYFQRHGVKEPHKRLVTEDVGNIHAHRFRTRIDISLREDISEFVVGEDAATKKEAKKDAARRVCAKLKLGSAAPDAFGSLPRRQVPPPPPAPQAEGLFVQDRTFDKEQYRPELNYRQTIDWFESKVRGKDV